MACLEKTGFLVYNNIYIYSQIGELSYPGQPVASSSSYVTHAAARAIITRQPARHTY